MEASTAVDPLNEQLDKPLPESWRPENPGDTIYGTFLRLEEGPSQYAGPTPIVVIAEKDTDGVERSIWLFGNVIRTQFLKARPQPGEMIAVRFLGKRKAKNPQPGTSGEYNDWKVAVDRPAAQVKVDWGTVGGSSVNPSAAGTLELQPDPDEDIPF